MKVKNAVKQGYTRIERAQQLILKLDAHKKQADDNGEQDADDAADDPCREKRSQDIERGRAGTSGSQQRRSEGCSGRSGPLYVSAERRCAIFRQRFHPSRVHFGGMVSRPFRMKQVACLES